MRGHEHSTNTNELSGTVHGFVVQAGSVHGGIHVSGGGAREEVPPPWQLPPSVRITDRADELRALEAHRGRATEDGHPTLAAVSGLGGVGKTAVALAWLHTLRPHFPGGQLYADLGAQAPDGPADPGEVVARFLRALGVPSGQVPPALGERVALYRSLTGRAAARGAAGRRGDRCPGAAPVTGWAVCDGGDQPSADAGAEPRRGPCDPSGAPLHRRGDRTARRDPRRRPGRRPAR